jgi:hypothetical protein
MICLVLLSTLSFAQANGSGAKPSAHFRWSERKAHELDYGHTLAHASGLTEAEQRLVYGAVLVQLRKAELRDKEMFEGVSESDLRRGVRKTRIEVAGLGEGRTVIAAANFPAACGATGNCRIWIFRLTEDSADPLFDASEDAGGEVLTVRPWATNGMRDIVIGAHSSAFERYLVWYKFRDGRYRRWKCYDLSWGAAKRRKSPAISEESCR